MFAFLNPTGSQRLLVIASGGDDNALSIVVAAFPDRKAEHGRCSRSSEPLRLIGRKIIPDAHNSLISGNLMCALRHKSESGTRIKCNNLVNG